MKTFAWSFPFNSVNVIYVAEKEKLDFLFLMSKHKDDPPEIAL